MEEPSSLAHPNHIEKLLESVEPLISQVEILARYPWGCPNA